MNKKKPLNLEKKQEKKTGNLNRMIGEKTSRLREKIGEENWKEDGYRVFFKEDQPGAYKVTGRSQILSHMVRQRKSSLRKVGRKNLGVCQ